MKKGLAKRLMSIAISFCMLTLCMVSHASIGKAVTGTPIAVAAGGNHSLALMSDGTVYAWGDNEFGQLGDGTNTDSTTPVQVSGLTGIVAIAAGYNHSMALSSDGVVYTWGNNQYGQLGDLTTTNRNTPVDITMMPPVTTKIAAGYRHSLAICNTPDRTGMLFAWGYNASHQVDNSTSTAVVCPTWVNQLTNTVDIAGGTSHSVAVFSNGTVKAWGSNQFGQLGDGTFTDRSIPTQVLNITNAVAITAGDCHTIAKLSNNTLSSWGHNGACQLGDFTVGTGSYRNTPGPCNTNGLTPSSIAAGGSHNLILGLNGNVYGHGNNGYGELGIRPYLGWFYPQDELENSVALSIGVSNARSIAAGWYHSLVVKNDGTVWALGRNNQGQLGDGTTTNRNVAVQIYF